MLTVTVCSPHWSRGRRRTILRSRARTTGPRRQRSSPSPEPHRPALVWTPTSPFDDSEVRDDRDDLDDPDDPDEPDFFRRLAAEIREDPRVTTSSPRARSTRVGAVHGRDVVAPQP